MAITKAPACIVGDPGAPGLYLSGFYHLRTGATQIGLLGGCCLSEDRTTVIEKYGTGWNANISTYGVNGRDYAAAVLPNTWHYVHVIYNPTTQAVDALISLSDTAPTLPAGYTKFRYVGAILTGAGAPVPIINYRQFGNDGWRITEWLDSRRQVLINGSAFLAPTIVSTATAQPPTSEYVIVAAHQNVAGMTLFLAGGYFAAALGNYQFRTINEQEQRFELNTDLNRFWYWVTNGMPPGLANIWVVGFKEDLCKD